MSSSAAERHTLSYNDVEWYPYLTTKKEDTDDDTIYAPSSTLLLSSLIAGAEDDEHYYTTFSSYKEMYEYVDAHKEDVSHPLFEVLTPSRYRKLFVTFQTSSSEVAMEVAKGFSSLLTRFCKDAYSAPEVEEHTRRQQAFSPEDIRIYRNGDVWRVVDAVRMYASARHTSHVQKIIYGELCKIPGVAFANDTAVFYHLPVLTPYLYGKDAEGAYTSFDAELKKETTYRVAPHDYNPWSQSGGGVLTEHYNAAMMRDSYVTSTEKTVKMCTHYCVPPSSVHCDEALVLPYTYFQMCNPDMKAMYRDGAFIRSHHPWFCCMCKEEHPVDYCIEMYYQKNEEQYYYKCDGGNVSSSDEFGSIRGRSISTVTFPLSAEAFEEYMVTGSFPYPHPRMFAADRDVEFLGFGKLVPPGDPGRMGSSGPAWPATNFRKKWSQCPRPALQPPSYNQRTTEAAQTRAYHSTILSPPSIDFYLDNEHVYHDIPETAEEVSLLSDAGAIINALLGITQIAADIAYFYKLIGGNTIINWYTGEQVHVRKQFKVSIFLPSAIQEAAASGKKAKPMKVTFSLAVLMGGSYRQLNQLQPPGHPDPLVMARAMRKWNFLAGQIVLHHARRPEIPKTPCVTPFFYGDRIPLHHGLDINMSKGFPCNPKEVANPDLDPKIRIETQFPVLRKLYLHGYCSSNPEKAHVLWSHEAYPLGHLHDPQTYKAIFFGGPQGSIKSSYSSNLKAVYGESMVSVSPHQICGKFNTALEGSIMVTIDEPSASSSKNYNDTGLYKDALKKIIAGDGFLSIEGKGANVYSVKNLCNVVISTNHFNTGLLDTEDKRRFIVLATRCLGITEDGVLITSVDESFNDPRNAETQEQVKLADGDTVAMVKERFLEAYCEEVNQPNFVNEFARYLLDYNKVYDTSFIRNYVQPADDAARSEMLNMTSTSCGEFFEDFLSDEYIRKTKLSSIQEWAPYKKEVPTGFRSYYLQTACFHDEYKAWYRKKYAAGNPTADRYFSEELANWCAMRSNKITYHANKGRRGETRLKVGDKHVPTGIQFVSAANYYLDPMAIPDVPQSVSQSPAFSLPTLPTQPSFYAHVPLTGPQITEVNELRDTVKKQAEMMQQQAEMMQMMQQQMQMMMQQQMQMMQQSNKN